MDSIWQHAERLRHTLHQFPELGWQEEKTAELIRQELTALSIPWRPCARLGTVAVLNPEGGAYPHTALRADMDALPITEQSQVVWQSQHEGCMHACGHDGHTATLLASARLLKSVEHQLPGKVSLLFQPAEEGGHGAKKMIDDGALEGVDQIYGWHNWPALAFGKLICPNNIVMCGNGTFRITVTGEGGHASQPELCQDPILAVSAMVMNLQQIVSRRLAPQQAAVVSVTAIDAPSGPTVIPATAVISGSIRVPNTTTRERVNHLMTEICHHTAQSYGCQAQVEISPRYEATINHPIQATQVRHHWQAMQGEAALDDTLSVPIMASEDFSYYLQEIPGAFALVGANDGPEHAPVCHSPFYDFNDRLIPLVSLLYARLVGVTLNPKV